MHRRAVKKCWVPSCESVESDKIMFMLPRDEERRASWEKAVGWPLIVKGFICEDHFVLEEDTENWVRYRLMPGTRLSLKTTAVPHRFDFSGSQSQFAGYAERFEEEYRNKKPRQMATIQPKQQRRKSDEIRFLGGPHLSSPFNGNRGGVPCTCEAGSKHLDSHATGNVRQNEIPETQMTIKQEPEEYEENYDFPMVIIKEEPHWDGMAPEYSPFETEEEPPFEDDPPHQTAGEDHHEASQCSGGFPVQGQGTTDHVCHIRSSREPVFGGQSENGLGPKHLTKNVAIEVESSEESERYLSSPSSPSTPADDSDKDPEYNIDREPRFHESTDDDEPSSRQIISDGTYVCYWCNKVFKLRRWMKTHLYQKHSGEKPYACNKCDFRATFPKGIRDHKFAAHSAKRRFVCDICNQRYSTKNALGRHKLYVHQKEKRFSCGYCDFKSNYGEKLKMHTMRHTGEKPHECKVCKARFIHPTALKTHKMIHTGEKPYACDRCDYRCRQSGMLTAHKRVHHPEKIEDDS